MSEMNIELIKSSDDFVKLMLGYSQTLLEPKTILNEKHDALLAFNHFFGTSVKDINEITNIDCSLDHRRIENIKSKIGNSDYQTFLKHIGSFHNLKKLNLSYNNLFSLPEGLETLSNLQELYLSGNNLSSLPESIGSLSNLRELYLSFNNLSSLPEGFGNLVKLEKLDLSFNNLSSLPESVKKLKKNNPKLKVLK